MNKPRFLLLGLAPLLALLLTACPGPSPTTLTVTPATLTLNAGSPAQPFTATSSNPNSAVSWSLSPASGAGSISPASGPSTAYTPPAKVTAQTSVTLTATLSDSTTAKATITLNPASAASLELTPAAPVLDPGKTQAFTVVAKDAGGNVLPTPALTWASSDPSVASVDSNGLVSVKTSGISAITAKAGSLSSNAVNLIVRPSGILSYSVFNSATSTYQVHQTKLDGTQDIKIADGWNPHFSPDGRFVAYQRDGTHPSGLGDSLYIYDLGTATEQKTVTSGGDYLVSSGWTPDSLKLVFDYSCSIYQVKRVEPNPGAIRSSNCYDDAPNTSPLDGKIAFHNAITGGLWLMNSDGSAAATIPNTQVGDTYPAWSPDGKWISFLRGDKSNTLKGVLYKIHPDGSGLTRLTLITLDASSSYVKPTAGWTPDGKFVVAAMVSGGTSSVQLVDAGGSGAMAPIPVANPDKVDFVGNTVVSTP